MSKNFLNWLESEAVHPLTAPEYNLVPVAVRQFVESNCLVLPETIETYACSQCDEHCVLDVHYDPSTNQPYFRCPTGFLNGRQQIPHEETQGVIFQWNKFYDALCASIDAELIDEPAVGLYKPFGYIAEHNKYLVLAPTLTFPVQMQHEAIALRESLGAHGLILITVPTFRKKPIALALHKEGIVFDSIERMVDSEQLGVVIEPDALEEVRIGTTELN